MPDRSSAMTCRCTGQSIHHFQLYFVLLLSACATSQHAHASRQTGLSQTQLKYLLILEPNLHLTELGQVSDDSLTLERVFLSPAHSQARHQIKQWMHAAGLRTWVDEVANVHGRADASDATAPALVMGSHYDTVKDAGRFDGALGILGAIAAVKTTLLQRAVQAGLLTPSHVDSIITGQASIPNLLSPGNISQLFTTPLEVIAFSDEEGVRFQTTLLGSRAVVGALVEPTNLLKHSGQDGLSVEEALRQHGFDTSLESVRGIAMRPDQVTGYVEVHLEQGPVLEVAGQALGVVSSIAGQTRLSVSILGTQGHAGTVPMIIRRDPLAAAAEAIYTVEQRCAHGSAHGGVILDPADSEAGAAASRDEAGLVCTVGSIAVWPGASNVIPASANFSVDIRAPSDVSRAGVVSDVMEIINSVCKGRGLQCVVGRVHDAEAVQCSQNIVQDLVAAVKASQKVFESCKLAGTETSQQSSSTAASPYQHAGDTSTMASGSSHEHHEHCTSPDQASDICQADLTISADEIAGGMQSTDAASKKQHLISSNDRAEDREAQSLAAAVTEDQEVQMEAAAALQRGGAEVPVLVSGAGHDGLAMANLTKIGMLFVRCRGGVSHSPLEHVSADDVGQATVALFTYLQTHS